MISYGSCLDMRSGKFCSHSMGRLSSSILDGGASKLSDAARPTHRHGGFKS